MSADLYGTLLGLGRRDRTLFTYHSNEHNEILNTLEKLVKDAVITTSWNTLTVTVPGYNGNVNFHTLISECLSFTGKNDASPDFQLKCYYLLKKLTNKYEPKQFDTIIGKLFGSCLTLLGYCTLPREQTLVLYTCPPEKASTNEQISPFFRFTQNQFNEFFPGQNPHKVFTEIQHDSFGNHIQTDKVCIASKLQMKNYNTDRKTQ